MRIRLLIFLLTLYFNSTGCSLIGLGIGAAIDSEETKANHQPRNIELRIQQGDFITVALLDGSFVRGSFVELIHPSDESDIYAIAVQTGVGLQDLPLESVKEIWELRSTGSALIGFGIGVVLDYLAIRALIIFFRDFGPDIDFSGLFAT